MLKIKSVISYGEAEVVILITGDDGTYNTLALTPEQANDVYLYRKSRRKSDEDARDAKA
jgi:hypothetical protein